MAIVAAFLPDYPRRSLYARLRLPRAPCLNIDALPTKAHGACRTTMCDKSHHFPKLRSDRCITKSALGIATFLLENCLGTGWQSTILLRDTSGRAAPGTRKATPKMLSTQQAPQAPIGLQEVPTIMGQRQAAALHALRKSSSSLFCPDQGCPLSVLQPRPAEWPMTLCEHKGE